MKHSAEEVAAYLREMADEFPVNPSIIGTENEMLSAAADLIDGFVKELRESKEEEAAAKGLIGLVAETHEVERDALREATFELAAWAELKDGEEVWHEVDGKSYRTEVKGPLGDLMVVVMDREVLDQIGNYDVMMDVFETTLERSREALKAGGWKGEVMMVTSDFRFMKLQMVEG